jgi:hypothetical protein
MLVQLGTNKKRYATLNQNQTFQLQQLLNCTKDGGNKYRSMSL